MSSQFRNTHKTMSSDSKFSYFYFFSFCSVAVRSCFSFRWLLCFFFCSSLCRNKRQTEKWYKMAGRPEREWILPDQLIYRQDNRMPSDGARPAEPESQRDRTGPFRWTMSFWAKQNSIAFNREPRLFMISHVHHDYYSIFVGKMGPWPWPRYAIWIASLSNRNSSLTDTYIWPGQWPVSNGAVFDIETDCCQFHLKGKYAKRTQGLWNRRDDWLNTDYKLIYYHFIRSLSC